MTRLLGGFTTKSTFYILKLRKSLILRYLQINILSISQLRKSLILKYIKIKACSRCSDLQEILREPLSQWKPTIPTPKRSVNFPTSRMPFTATPFVGAFYVVGMVVRRAASNWGQQALSRRQSPYSNPESITSAGTCPRGSSC